MSASVAGLLAFGSFGLAHLTLGLDLGLAMVLAMGLAGLDGLDFGRGMWLGSEAHELSAASGLGGAGELGGKADSHEVQVRMGEKTREWWSW